MSDNIGYFTDDLSIPPGERAYVNRNLRLSSIEAIGFDLDHTLAHYDQLSVGDLAFIVTKNKLIQKRGLPPEINELPFDPDFVIRGLVVDLDRGNLLKMDCHNYVHRATHGKSLMSSSDRKRIYASERFKFPNNTYASVDSLFHVPEVCLYLSLIDFIEKINGNVDPRKLFFDVREMIDEAHGDGTIKSKIISNPGQYIQGDPGIYDVFDRIRQSGKKLFLLTNSETDYTDSLMNYIKGLRRQDKKWMDYFDFIITKANKPDFFSRRHSKKSVPNDLSPKVFEGGNAFELEKKLGCRADKIIYFGDHTYGDILKAKKTMGWRTGMIVPELKSEIEAAISTRKAYHRLVNLTAQRRLAEEEKDRLASAGQTQQDPVGNHDMEQIQETKIHALEKRIQRFADEIDTLESLCQFAYNPSWGSLFREGKQISSFAHQVRDFACIYMHHVTNLLNYPDDHYFQTNVDFMPHELFL